MAPLVSVLVPSRGRPGALEKSLAGLLDLATAPAQIEILIAADPDDEATLALPLPWQASRWTAPQRYGYTHLNEYYNALATQATGRWQMLWNDDARMVTPGWDSVLAERTEDVLLWPYVPEEEGMNCFPIWPASWPKLMGHVSLDTFNDRWMIDVAERTGRYRHVEITVSHQRDGGQSADLATFYREEMVRAREADARVIAAAFPDAWNKDLVSVLLPRDGRLPQVIQGLCDDAARPGDLEFLVAAGDAHCEVRRTLADAGLMGRTEVHASHALADIAGHAHGGHVVWWDHPTLDGPGWDETVRGHG